MFPKFEILGKTIGMYGLCAVIGLLICGFTCYTLTKKRGTEPEDIILAVVFTGIGVLIGGHLLYGIVNLPHMISALQAAETVTFSYLCKLLIVTFGGSVFYGGFLGSLFAICLYGKHKKNTALYLDMFAIMTPLFHTFGRIGCFFAGCCYGIESKFGFTAHNNSFVPDVNDVSRFPVQLLEAVLNFSIFFLLSGFFKKEKLSGKLVFLYMLTYAPIRFSLEFLRGDAARGSLLWFSTSQWISLLLFPIALVSLFLSLRRTAVKQ